MPGHIYTLLAYTTILCCVKTVKRGCTLREALFDFFVNAKMLGLAV